MKLHFLWGCFLYVGGSVIPIALLPSPSLRAQTWGEQCRPQQEETISQWLERSRMYAQNQRPQAAATALGRVLTLVEQSPRSSDRMVVLRTIGEEQPTGILSSLVNSVQEAKQPEIALTLLPRVQLIAQSLPTAYSAVKTDSLTAIARAYLVLNQPAQARIALDQATTAATFLRGEEFQAKALTAIAQGYFSLGDTTRTRRILDRALLFAQRMRHPNPLRRLWVLDPIARLYGQWGDGEQAIALADQMLTLGSDNQSYQQAIYEIVARQAIQQGDRERAIRVGNRLTSPTAQAVLWAEWAGQRAEAKQPTEAKNLREQAIATAQKETDPLQRGAALGALILAYGRNGGNLRDVVPLLTQIGDPAIRGNGALDLAALTNDRPQRQTLRQQALTAAMGMASGNDRDQILNRLIQDYIAEHAWGRALRIAHDAPDESLFGNKYSLISEIGLKAAKAGERTEAIRAIALLPDSWEDPRNQIWQAVALDFAQRGQWPQALDQLPRITNYGSYPYRILTLGAIATIAYHQGETERARDLLQQGQRQIAQEQLRGFPQAYALGDLSLQYQAIGDRPTAQDLQRQAQTIALGEEASSSTYALQQLVKLYLEAQADDLALATAITLPPDHPDRPWLLNDIAETFMDQRQVTKAIGATAVMTDPREKTGFLIRIAQEYIADGQWSQAITVLDQALTTAQRIPGKEEEVLIFREPPDQTIIDDPNDRGSALETIALLYADLQQREKAQGAIAAIQSPQTRKILKEKIHCAFSLPHDNV